MRMSNRILIVVICLLSVGILSVGATAQRRFYAGEAIETAAFITNDDEQFRDLHGLTLQLSFVDERTKKTVTTTTVGNINSLPYYATIRQPLSIRVPETKEARQSMNLVLRLTDGRNEISRTLDRIEVFGKPVQPAAPLANSRAITLALGTELQRFVNEARVFQNVSHKMPSNTEATRSVLLVGGSLNDLQRGGRARELVEQGATVVLFSPGKSIADLFPQDVLEVKKVTGEYADYAPSAGTKLTEGLHAMDIKWWGRRNDWRVFVAGSTHRLKPNGAARELIRFIPSHGYIPVEKVPEQYMSVLFEIPLGLGRVWVCDLDLEESVSIDPAARIFARNLLNAAADANSTRNLTKVPTHEELLAGKKVGAK